MARILPIVSIVLIVALMVSGIFLWWPQLQEFLSLKEELEAKRSQLEEKKVYFSQLEEYDKKLEDYSEELEKINYALPGRISSPAIFSFFLQICSVNGLVLENISARGSVAGNKEVGSLEEFRFSATVSGSYEKFKDFLVLLYENSRIIDVENVSFKSPREGSVFEIDLSLKTHYLPGESTSEEPFPGAGFGPGR